VPEDMDLEKLRKYLNNIFNECLEKKISTNDLLNHGDALWSFFYRKYVEPEWAEYPWFPDSDSRSISLYVLEYLTCGGSFNIIQRDIPYFIELLNTPEGKEKEGYETFKSYIRNQTLRARIEEARAEGSYYGENHGFDLDKPYKPL
jgi:hypothetical protein